VPADRNIDRGDGKECAAAGVEGAKPINEITFDHIYNLIENPMLWW
jgi:hypothetical protein